MTDDGSAAALATLGVPPDRASELIAGGVTTVKVGGRLLAMAGTTEPLTGEHHVLVSPAVDQVVAAGRLAELHTLAALRYPAATTLVLRLAADTPPAALPSARLLMRYVEHDAPLVEAQVPASWAIREYRPDYRAAVRDLLLRALRTGYATVSATMRDAEAEELVDDLLDRAGDNVHVFCALHGDVFAGHATVVWDEDDLTGSVRPELFDLFILPEWRGSPASRLLTSAAVLWARQAGFPLRGHVVGGGAAADEVFRRLTGTGWRAAESYWALSLKGEPTSDG